MAERDLWAAVVQTAFEDALGRVVKVNRKMNENKKSALIERNRQIIEARMWFNSRDFPLVCSYAGLDPEATKDAYLRQLGRSSRVKRFEDVQLKGERV